MYSLGFGDQLLRHIDSMYQVPTACQLNGMAACAASGIEQLAARQNTTLDHPSNHRRTLFAEWAIDQQVERPRVLRVERSSKTLSHSWMRALDLRDISTRSSHVKLAPCGCASASTESVRSPRLRTVRPMSAERSVPAGGMRASSGSAPLPSYEIHTTSRWHDVSRRTAANACLCVSDM